MSKKGNKETATKRIKKEIASLAKEDLGEIILTPDESNIFRWRAKLPGPAGSPYEGGLFDVDVRIPEDYPFSPPQLAFLTRVYHCNIAATGAICLDVLKGAWSPALSIFKIILSLSSLLTDPNPSDPLVPAIAQEYRKNRKKHDQTAREWTKLYAQSTAPPPVAVAAPTRPPAQPRLHSITRPEAAPSSASGTPPPVLAGSRRSHAEANGNGIGAGAGAAAAAGPSRAGAGGSSAARPFELSDDDDGMGDIEVLGENGRGANGRGVSVATATATAGRRTAKRARTGGNGASAGARGAGMGGDDDPIVIDE